MAFFKKISLLAVLLALAACAPKPPKPDGVSIDPNGGDGGIVIVPKTAANRPAMRLEWMSPTLPGAGQVVPVYRKLNMELRTYTTAELKDSDFKVYVDDRPYGGSKAGEAPLIRQKQEYIFRKTLEFPDAQEGQRYRVRVEVNNGGVPEKSRTLIVEATTRPPNINIVWISPDVTESGGLPYLQTEPLLDVVVNINAGGSALELGDVRMRLNDQIIPPTKEASLRPSGASYSFRDKVPMTTGISEQTLAVIVENAESEPAKIRYRPGKKPNLYVLSIGAQTNLQYTVQDATDFADLFADQKTGNALYGDVSVEKLLRTEAKTQKIRESIEGLVTKMQTNEISPNDLVIIFLSTHGFLLSNDFRLQGDDFNSARSSSTSVSFSHDIMEVIQGMPCKKLIFMDACHSGGAFDSKASGGRATASEVERALVEMNKYKSGLAVLASSSGDEISYEDVKWKNGAFTEAIVKGLKFGKADANANGIVTVNELQKYLKMEVPSLVSAVKNKVQTPNLYDPDKIAEIPIYIVKK